MFLSSQALIFSEEKKGISIFGALVVLRGTVLDGKINYLI